jgi:hypothetical protein
VGTTDKQRIGPFSRVSFMREIHPENQAVRPSPRL